MDFPVSGNNYYRGGDMKERLIEILSIAVRYRISDIHFEMKKTEGKHIMKIEMRVNGVM